MSFSERMGLRPKKAIQIKSMDQDLRVGLWNALLCTLFKSLDQVTYIKDSEFEPLVRSIWADHFKLSLDTLPIRWDGAKAIIRDRYFMRYILSLNSPFQGWSSFVSNRLRIGSFGRQIECLSGRLLDIGLSTI